MAGGKETPRQKMIGMMYLVLTALLALNVSKDILDAFVLVDETLVKTNENFQRKNDLLYNDFAKAMRDNAAKTKPFYDKAMKAQQMSNDIVKYIKEIKAEMISTIEKIDKKSADTIRLMYIQNKDNYDEPTRLIVGENHATGAGGKGEKLMNKLTEYKTNMLNLLEPDQRKSLGNLGFDFEEKFNKAQGKKVNWVINTFYHTIQCATIVMFNQMIAQVRNAESDVVMKLKESIFGKDFKFDKISAKVIAKSNYILLGDKYEADIFVAAYSTTQNPEVRLQEGLDTAMADFMTRNPNAKKLGGSDASTVSNGVVKYSAPASGEGLKKFAGVINIKNPGTGEIQSYPFNSEYVVARPAAVVSADAMNVFYMGLDNPLSVSVPGIPTENVNVTIAGGTITKKGNGKFMVRVSSPGKVKVSVSAKIGNSSKPMGAMEYRVKKVPNPIPMICGQKNGMITKGKITAMPVVVAILEDFLFDGVKFTITSFKFSSVLKSGEIQNAQCSGNKLDAKALGYIAKASSGQKIFFEEIKAVGPDGTSRTLPDMIFKIQ